MIVSLGLNIYMSENAFTNFYNISYNSELWQNCLYEIQKTCQQDYLYENYINLNPEHYFFFNGIIHNKTIAAFAAIEYSPHKWGNAVARVLTRYWIHPNFRSHNLTKWTAKKVKVTPFVLGPQIEFLKSHKNIKIAMMTRQGSHRRGLDQFLKITNTIKDCNFELLSGLFNVCEPMIKIPEPCQQHIAISKLEEFNWDQYLQTMQDQGRLKRMS
jgi:hypothetical protein